MGVSITWLPSTRPLITSGDETIPAGLNKNNNSSPAGTGGGGVVGEQIRARTPRDVPGPPTSPAPLVPWHISHRPMLAAHFIFPFLEIPSADMPGGGLYSRRQRGLGDTSSVPAAIGAGTEQRWLCPSRLEEVFL